LFACDLVDSVLERVWFRALYFWQTTWQSSCYG